jgi:hypothetical protein
MSGRVVVGRRIFMVSVAVMVVAAALIVFPNRNSSANAAPSSCTTSATNGSCVFPQDTTDFPGINPGTGRPASQGIEVDQNIWNTGSCPGLTQTLSANSPEDFQVQANYPTSSTGAICAYPNVWPHDAQGAVDSYQQTTSTFSESFPHNAGTQAHAMFDLWFNNWANEVMVQYDFSNDAPCEGSWPEVKTNVNFTEPSTGTSQPWHLCTGGSQLSNGSYPSLVWKLGAADGAQEQSESTGSVNLLSMLQYLENDGYLPANSTWTALSMGWEIASTGGQNETFTGSGFTADMVPNGGTTTTTTTSPPTTTTTTTAPTTTTTTTAPTTTTTTTSPTTTTTTSPTTTTTTSPTTTTTTSPTTTTTTSPTTTTTTRPTTTTTTRPSRKGGGSGSDTSPPPSNNPPPAQTGGYWLVGSDGGIFNFGSANFDGSAGSLPLQRPVVGITRDPSNSGYWLVASDGGVFAFNAPFVGSLPGLGLHPAGSGLPNSLNAPIVGMVPSANGQGYYMVSADGGVFAFNATFAGSCPSIGGCVGTTVAVAPDASGNGYWLVTNAGNIYAFGDARYLGAPGAQSSAITAMVRTPDGGGYYILDGNGQVFAYGDADASLGGLPAGTASALDPATAIFDTPNGGGYWISTSLGKVDSFGNAPDEGDMSSTHLNEPIIAATGF